MRSILLVSLLWANSTSHFTLLSLKDVSSHKVDLKQTGQQTFIVFQEDCSACQEQVQDLSCLEPTSLRLIGAFASEKALRKEYRKMKTKAPAYLGTAELLVALGVSQGLTPQIVLISPNGRRHFLGLTSCQEIKQAFQELASS